MRAYFVHVERPVFHPRRVIAWSAVIALVLTVAVVLPEVVTILFAGFAGMVGAAALTGMAGWVSRHTKLSLRWSVVLVIFLGLVVVASYVVWTVFVTAPQLMALMERVPQALADLQEALRRMGVGDVVDVEAILESPLRLLRENDSLRSRLLGVFTNGVAVVAGLVLVLFLAMYTALESRRLAGAVVRLFPPHRRARMGSVGAAVSVGLQRWLVGRSFSAGVVGISTGIAVWALGVPLPLSLGILAALLTFVPNIGPVLTMIPAGLLALTVSPTIALVVLGIYVGVQFLESYLLTPIVQERAVHVPPSLLLFTQALFGVLFGLLGVVLAAPLLAVGIVLTRELYVEDRLESEAEEDEEREDAAAPEAPPRQVPAE